METSAAINELAAALAKAQGEMAAADKLATNPHYNKKYATLANVRDALRRPLANNGLAVTQTLANCERGIRVATLLVHASGQWIRDSLEIPCPRMDAQGVGTAATYGLRYSLQAITGIAPDDAADDDGERNRQDVAAAPPPTTKPAPAEQSTPEEIEELATDAINDLDAATPEARTARLAQIEERIDKRKELSAEQRKRLSTLIQAKRLAWGEVQV